MSMNFFHVDVLLILLRFFHWVGLKILWFSETFYFCSDEKFEIFLHNFNSFAFNGIFLDKSLHRQTDTLAAYEWKMSRHGNRDERELMNWMNEKICEHHISLSLTSTRWILSFYHTFYSHRPNFTPTWWNAEDIFHLKTKETFWVHRSHMTSNLRDISIISSSLYQRGKKTLNFTKINL